MTKLTSIKSLLAKLISDLDLKDQMKIQQVVEWIYEGCKLIGMVPTAKKTVELQVESYRTPIPEDALAITRIQNEWKQVIRKGSDVFYSQHRIDHGTIPSLSPSFHREVPTYKLNGCFIDFSFEAGKVVIDYTATEVDDEGMPLIPDVVSYQEALLYYVVYKLKLRSFMHGSISDGEFERSEARWKRYKLLARNELRLPTDDEYQTLINHWVVPFPRVSDNTRGFVDSAQKQIED